MDILNVYEILAFYLLSLMVPRVLLPLTVHQIIAVASDPYICSITSLPLNPLALGLILLPDPIATLRSPPHTYLHVDGQVFWSGNFS